VELFARFLKNKESNLPKLRSAKKSLRQSRVSQIRNQAIRTTMRNAIKQVRQAADTPTAQTALGHAVSVIDKTVNKGILHRNTAARYKSRLTRQVQGLS